MAYDLVIKNGVVIDGSGLPRYRPTSGSREGASFPSAAFARGLARPSTPKARSACSTPRTLRSRTPVHRHPPARAPD
jgi:hypothetical protein